MSILDSHDENVSKFASYPRTVQEHAVRLSVCLSDTVGVFFEIGFAGFAQFVVPFLAEAGGQRAFEEFVETQTEFAAEGFRRAAYLPAMVVDGREIGILGETERVEVARCGFEKIDATLAACFLDGAKAFPVRAIAGESAVAPVDNRCHEVTLLINVCHTVFFHLTESRRYHIFLYLGQHFLDAFHLFGGNRCSGVTFDAALSETGVKVAAEKLLGKIKRDQYILYL